MKFKIGLRPQYEYDGKWRDAKMTLITVPIKGSAPFIRPAIYTHLGPLITQPDMKTGEAYVGASPYLDQMGLSDEFYKMTLAGRARRLQRARAQSIQRTERDVCRRRRLDRLRPQWCDADPPGGLRLKRTGAGDDVGDGVEGNPPDRRPGPHLQSAAGLHAELQHQPREHDGRLAADPRQVSPLHLQRVVGHQ